MNRLIYVTMLVIIWAGDHAANAQPFCIGLRGGPSIPQLTNGGNEVSRDYASILTANYGAVVEYYLNNHVSLQLEVNYSGQGGERKGFQPITKLPSGTPKPLKGKYYYADFDNKSVLEYLEVPIMGKFQGDASSHWRYYLQGGPYIGFLLCAEQETKGSSAIFLFDRTIIDQGPHSFKASTDVKSDLNEFNFGCALGIGVAYMLTKSNQIFFDIRGQYGLTSIQKNTERDGSSNTGAALFLLGYKHHFGG